MMIGTLVNRLRLDPEAMVRELAALANAVRRFEASGPWGPGPRRIWAYRNGRLVKTISITKRPISTTPTL